MVFLEWVARNKNVMFFWQPAEHRARPQSVALKPGARRPQQGNAGFEAPKEPVEHGLPRTFTTRYRGRDRNRGR